MDVSVWVVLLLMRPGKILSSKLMVVDDKCSYVVLASILACSAIIIKAMLCVPHYRICQGMSWQHLHQPCVAGRCKLSLSSLSLSLIQVANFGIRLHLLQPA